MYSNVVNSMKKSYMLFVVLSLLLCQCTSSNGGNENDSCNVMTRIDTANVVPTLKAIIKEYVATYPEYKCLALESNVVLRKNPGIDAENIYSLGPATMMRYGEYYGKKRLFPSSYMVVGGRMVFVNSSNDKFARQDLFRNFYMKHLEIKENVTDFLDKFWLIKIGNDGFASVLSKDVGKDAGIERVENSSYDELMKSMYGIDSTENK